MIGTARKPFSEVMGALEAFRKIGVVGCDGCAKACATGGTAQVEEMKKSLAEHGKEVVFVPARFRRIWGRFLALADTRELVRSEGGRRPGGFCDQTTG